MWLIVYLTVHVYICLCVCLHKCVCAFFNPDISFSALALYTLGTARQVYSYSAFHTQRQCNVLYINKSKRNVNRRNIDTALKRAKQYREEHKSWV